MKSADILALSASIKPTIVAAFDQAIAHVMERIKKLEADLTASEERVEELEKKALGDFAKFADLEEVRKLIPTAQQVAELVPHGEVADQLIKTMVIEQVANIPRLVQDGKDADPAVIKSMVAEAVSALPAPKDGKDADPDLIALLVAEQTNEVLKTWERPKDGKDADPELIKSMVAETVSALPAPKDGKDYDAAVLIKAVQEEVAATVAALPAPKDGKDADPEAIKSLVAEAVSALPAPKDGKDHDPAALTKAVQDEVADRMLLVTGELKIALPGIIDEAVKALPAPKDGKSVEPEEVEALVVKHVAAIPRIEGKPGESVTIEQLAPLVNDVVAKYFAEIPAPKDGKDGLGLAGAFIDREGELTVTFTDGNVKALGKVVGGRGEDGIKADDFDIVNGDDHFIVKLKVGDRFIEKRVEKASVADFYRGVWSAGLHKRGSLVTWGGSLWLAQKDTEVKPETKDNDDWKLVVKRGRDGKDFTPTGGK